MSTITWAEVDPAILTLREYLRVSHDASGRERSNAEQHDDNLGAVEREPRWQLSDLPAYRDVGSASRYAKKARGDFNQLVRDLAADRFPDDGLLIWESSRGSRRVAEWVTLLELCAERGKVIVVTTHGPRLYDPANDRDWRTLMEDAVDSEYETRKTSKRVRRNMTASANAGNVPGGRRAFGYTKDGKVLDDAEAKIVRELVRRVLAGESIRSLAADLNHRGVLTTAGNPWHPGPLKKMLTGTRIVGQRTHHGRVVAQGQWPAIIDEVTHRRVVATLAARSPVGRRGRTPWLLTGLLRCEHCGAALVGNRRSRDGVRSYICRKAPGYHGCGRLTVKADTVEEILGDLVTERLADTEARRSADTGPDDGDELAELDRIAVMRVEVADDKAAGKLSREQAAEDAAALDRRQREVEARLAAKVRKTAPLDFVAAEGFIGRPWADLQVAEQRVILDALVDRVTIGPSATRGSHTFDTDRVTAPGRIAWKV